MNELYRKQFQVNLYGRTSVPVLYLDRLKVCQFALKEEWFVNKNCKTVYSYPSDSRVFEKQQVRCIGANVINARERGASSVKENFHEWKFRLFPNDTTDLVLRE